MSRGLKEISTVIVRSNALTYGATEGGIRMLVMASGRTKDGSRERISTETLCCPGSRIYSLTGPDYKVDRLLTGLTAQQSVSSVNCSIVFK